MTQDQFRELCRGACRALGLNDLDALFQSADVRVDGVKVGILHNDEWDEEAVYCYADLGAIDSTAGTRLMEEVLAINLELDAGMGEVIGIERESGHLVLRARLTKSDEPLHGGVLADHLRGYAELANELYRNVLADVSRPGP